MLGWREWLALPEFGIDAIRAKVDTGARSSSLHVDRLETFSRDGREWVRFSIDPAGHGVYVRDCEAPVIDRRPVTDSGGQTSVRVFVRTTLRLGTLEFPIEMNLASRRGLRFPMLLGRTAMAGRCVVDPARSFQLGALRTPRRKRA